MARTTLFDTVEAERHLLMYVNEKRRNAGVHPLAYDPELSEIARKYSEVLAKHCYFDHRITNGKNPEQRLAEAGYSGTTEIGVGENIFRTCRVIDSTNVRHSSCSLALATGANWMNSEHDKENILFGMYSRTGVGIIEKDLILYVTELFV